ncbi:MAG: nuclear transport factor 2 family protein [Paracoccaceae bacterium]
MDAGSDTHETVAEAVRARAVAYAEALWRGDAVALEGIFHPAAHLYASQDGALIDWPRAQFLDRVAARSPGEGPAEYTIREVSVVGPEMAHVALDVAVPERRFTDYLNFLMLDGEWRVIAKIFRVAEGPKV